MASSDEPRDTNVPARVRHTAEFPKCDGVLAVDVEAFASGLPRFDRRGKRDGCEHDAAQGRRQIKIGAVYEGGEGEVKINKKFIYTYSPEEFMTA